MNISAFGAFADTLVAEQKSAIKHLSLWAEQTFGYGQLPARHFRNMVSLKHLELILVDYSRPIPSPFLSALQHLIRLPLEEVSVVFHELFATPHYSFFRRRAPPRSSADQTLIADTIKTYLLQDWEQLERERMATLAIKRAEKAARQVEKTASDARYTATREATRAQRGLRKH